MGAADFRSWARASSARTFDQSSKFTAQVPRDKIATEGVDLIYLDPRLNSNANYTVLFCAPSGERSQAGF